MMPLGQQQLGVLQLVGIMMPVTILTLRAFLEDIEDERGEPPITQLHGQVYAASLGANADS